MLNQSAVASIPLYGTVFMEDFMEDLKQLSVMDKVSHQLHDTIVRQQSGFSGRLLSQTSSTKGLYVYVSVCLSVCLFPR